MAEIVTPKGANKRESDQSMRFKCIGGPLHEAVVRMWPPYDYLRFQGNDGQYHVYELCPPLQSARSKMWVLVHNEDASNEENAQGENK